jgi:hypothetical protein
MLASFAELKGIVLAIYMTDIGNAYTYSEAGIFSN